MALSVRLGALWNRNVATEHQIALIVSVQNADGKGVDGLSADNFSVYAFDRFTGAGSPLTPTKAAPAAAFQQATEPRGVYGMATSQPPQGGWSDEELVIVVEVETDNDIGRGLINPIITKH